MSKYKMFKMFDYLARDTAKSAQLDIDDDDDDMVRRLAAQLIPAPDETAPQSETLPSRGYYSVIARAVSRLPNNTHEAREALYDRAAVALAAELLHEQGPQLSDAQLANERLALERAIRKVEREAGKQAPSAVREGKHRRPFSSFLSFFRVPKP